MGKALRQQLVDETDDPDLLFADGFDDAIVGFIARCGQPVVVVYDREKCIEILMSCLDEMPKAMGTGHEIAEEYFSLNVEGSWVGPRTPAYLVRP